MKISIYENMFLNQQCISVRLAPAFLEHLEKQYGIQDVQLHVGNVYLFLIPPEGEFTELNSNQKIFIFEKEMSLFQEQYQIQIPYLRDHFQRFIEITWHGVVYHGEIKSL